MSTWGTGQKKNIACTGSLNMTDENTCSHRPVPIPLKHTKEPIPTLLKFENNGNLLSKPMRGEN